MKIEINGKDKERVESLMNEGDPDDLFDLIKEQAIGSFGTVYLAQHKKDGDEVALKIIGMEEGESLEEMLIEIEILKKCNHKNIVRHYGSWLREEELFIAMEFCSYGSLLEIFDDFPQEVIPCNEAEISFIIQETLKGLSYLHSNGIIHRDLKASNILVDAEGQIKLADFGVSAQLTKERPNRTTLIGTPYWMAPEVINMDVSVPYDARADIWSLGITAIELAEKNPPLVDLAPMRALCLIPFDPPPTLKDKEKWGSNFQTFIATCLRKSPKRRPNADELMDHPFIRNCEEKNLMSLIEKRDRLHAETEERKAEAKQKLEAFLEEMESKKSENSKTPAINQSTDSIEDNSNSEVNSPVSSPSNDAPLKIVDEPKEEKENEDDEEPMEVVSSRLKMDRKTSLSDLDRKVTITRAGLKSTIKDRSSRPVTIRLDETMRKMAAQRLNQEKLVKIQLQAIRKLQNSHKKIEEALVEKQEAEKDGLMKAYHSRMKAKEKSRIEFESMVQKQITAEKDAARKDQAFQLKKEQKGTVTDEINKKKELQDTLKAEFKEEKEKQKSIMKETKKEWKSKNLESSERKKEKKKLTESMQCDEFRFQHKQHFHKCLTEHNWQLEAFDKVVKKQMNQLSETIAMNVIHQRKELMVKLETMNVVQEIRKSFAAQFRSLEAVHLQQKHQMSLEHLKIVLNLQRQQQESALKSERKAKIKEFKAKEKKEQKEVVSRTRGMTKTQSKRDFETTKLRALNELAAKHNQKEAQFEKELDALFQNEIERLEKAQKTQISHLCSSQEKELRDLQALHVDKEMKLIEKHHNEQISLLKELQANILTLLNEAHTEENTFEAESEVHKSSLLKDQHNQQKALLLSHQSSEITSFSNSNIPTDSLLEDHENQRKEMENREKTRVQQQKEDFVFSRAATIKGQLDRKRTLTQELEDELNNMLLMQEAQRESKRKILEEKQREQASQWSVNALDKSGQTKIHIACTNRDLKSFNSLLEEGADVNIQDKNGWTPLHCAAYSKFKEALEALLNLKETIVTLSTKNGTTALHYLCKSFDSNFYNEEKEHFLSKAVEKGANVEAQNDNGETLLHNSVLSGNLSIVRFLLDAGANVNSKTSLGETPLHWAVRVSNNLSVILELLERGADPLASGKYGNAIDIHKNCDNDPEVIKAIEEASSSTKVPVNREPKTPPATHKNLSTLISSPSFMMRDTPPPSSPFIRNPIEETQPDNSYQEILQTINEGTNETDSSDDDDDNDDDLILKKKEAPVFTQSPQLSHKIRAPLAKISSVMNYSDLDSKDE